MSSKTPELEDPEKGTEPDRGNVTSECVTTSSLSDTNISDDATVNDDKESCLTSMFPDLAKYAPLLSLSTMYWLQEEINLCGGDTIALLAKISGYPMAALNDFSKEDALNLIVSRLKEPCERSRLPYPKTLNDVVDLIKNSKKIFVLTGAGISVSCGIPDFRSEHGIYARLAEEFPDLPDPRAMFDISYFQTDPKPFFRFAKEIYPGQFKPSPCHRFIKMLESKSKLLRNYSQNIDTLERVAGIENVLECHGSFATASCTKCKYKVKAEEIKDDIFLQKIPYCTKCSSEVTEEKDKGVLKPDIVFFGEDLPPEFDEFLYQDKEECDLLIVIGSSLKVRPVSNIPNMLPETVPQILINKERLHFMRFDVELIGESDIIVDHLCRQLGDDWTEICWRDVQLKQVHKPIPKGPSLFSSFSGMLLKEDEDTSNSKCEKNNDESSGHPPVDSSKESSTGEASNPCTDVPSPSSSESKPQSPIPHSHPTSSQPSCPTQPLKISVPDGVFFSLKKRLYAFPGAEL